MDHTASQHRSDDEVTTGSTASRHAAAVLAVRTLLKDLGTPGAAMPDRDRVRDVLSTALAAMTPAPAERAPSADLLRALGAMAGDPRIVSTGDLGRALDPSLNTERACALGGNRMRQLLAREWVVRERFARWNLTEEGRAAHREMTGGHE